MYICVENREFEKNTNNVNNVYGDRSKGPCKEF